MSSLQLAGNQKNGGRRLEGARFIEKIEGDYPTIVGLPLWQTAHLLEQQGVVLPKSVPKRFTG